MSSSHSFRQYYEREFGGGKFICKLCQKVLRGQSNMSAHVAKHFADRKKMREERYLVHRSAKVSRPITNDEQNIILWRCKKGIAFSAIDDDDFRNIAAHPEAVHSRQLMSTLQKEMSTQIMEKSFEEWEGCVLSICIDGGTIIHNKWIAIVGYGSSGSSIKYDLLDLLLMEESCTIENVVKNILMLQSKLATVNARICSACSDNALNMSGCFNNTIKGLSSHGIKDIIGISCSCHTGQLVLEDLAREDKNFAIIVNGLNEFTSLLSHKPKSFIEESNLTGYPPLIQKQ